MRMSMRGYAVCGGLLAFLYLGQQVASAQSGQIRATISGAPGDGKCTFEVLVDGSAELEIHGDQGNIRTLSGRPTVWRRLTCNQPLPNNPVSFQFQGIDGRGRQQLVRDPNSSGGLAVIRIDDPQGGSEGYTGDITWRGGENHFGGVGNWASGHAQEQQRQQDQQQRQQDQQQRPPDRQQRQPDWPVQQRDQQERGHDEWGQRISRTDAVNICRNQVVLTRNVPLNRVRAIPVGQEPDGDIRVNFTFQNAYGATKTGFCNVSGSGQILQFQTVQDARGGRVSWNQALELCQDEAAKTFGVARENVRVQHGADPGNGNFLINYQVQDRFGRIKTGACRVSGVGEIEELRRW